MVDCSNDDYLKGYTMTKFCKQCEKKVTGCKKNNHKIKCISCKKKSAANNAIAWAKQNPDKMKGFQKKYYDSHPDVIAGKIEYRRKQMKLDIPLRMFYAAKARAAKKGIKFTITKEDIIIPAKCPVLGMVLKISEDAACDHSPSLDRVIPAKGYTLGNINVISHKANTMKSNGTLEELEKVVLYLKGELSC